MRYLETVIRLVNRAPAAIAAADAAAAASAIQ
jgi:hypothetical protein